MPSAHLGLKEEDVIRLSLEFLQNRSLHISQLSLERESGVINGCYSDDALFLRQLILDGQWDDALEFVQPLQAVDAFDNKKFHFLILKYKYFELLCIKAEAPDSANSDLAVSELVKVLEEVSLYAPNKEAHSQLCLFLTTPQLHQHKHFKNWNPSSARVECWNEVYPLVEKYLCSDRTATESPAAESKLYNNKKKNMAKNDRLVQLLIKGLLYESCVEYCQGQATGTASPVSTPTLQFPSLLAPTTFNDSDLSLLSWLHSIPPKTFACPFEQRTLNVDVERLDKPSLEASWTEQLLITPIKPKVFPHSAIPYNRQKATDIMSRSLNPTLDGLALRNSIMVTSTDGNLMSKSIASFHLTGKKTMNTSVDRLFDTDNVFTGSAYGDLPTIAEKDLSNLSLNTDSPDLKESTKRPSSDSLNKPFLLDKSESDYSDDKVLTPSSRSHSPQPLTPLSNSTTPSHPPPNLNHHPLHQSVSAPPKPGQPFNPNKPGQPMAMMKPLPMGQPQQQPYGGQRSPYGQPSPYGVSSPYNNNNVTAPPPYETTELYNIYQKKQQNMPQYNNNSNRLLMSGGLSVASEVGLPPGPPTSDIFRGSPMNKSKDGDSPKPRFMPITQLEDVQAIRCAEFHPSGMWYAVGSNSKTLRVCQYPTDINSASAAVRPGTSYQPTTTLKRTKHHKGSIYCLAWSPMGDLLATASNDKTVKLLPFDADTCAVHGQEVELNMHDGTVRDLCFIEDSANKSSLLISGGAGDCKIYVTDIATGTAFQALSGHTSHILSLYTWGGAMFVSGSQDRSVRFWDLRTRGCVNVITPVATSTKPGSPVASVCVDPSGRLLVSGHEDSLCCLYDIRGSRTIQCFRPHSSDVRSIRFSPSAYYLLSAGYDNKLVLTDLQGDLTQPLPSVVVAEHADKAISGRWHPNHFSFISTSADKTCTLWALPPL